MTDTLTVPWIPVIQFQGNTEHCVLCQAVLDLATITLGAKDSGPVCEDCADALPDVGSALWKLCEALDSIDSAVWDLPQRNRPGVVGVAQEMLAKILEWRIGPITDEEKATFVTEMAAAGKMLRLSGGRMVKAAEYDQEKHGPFLP